MRASCPSRRRAKEAVREHNNYVHYEQLPKMEKLLVTRGGSGRRRHVREYFFLLSAPHPLLLCINLNNSSG